MPDEDIAVDGDLILHLEPLGLVCGGGPLRETWVDLRSRNHVFYGLNGAGKSTLLNALDGALKGIAPGGRILVEMPVGEEHERRLAGGAGDRLSEMFTGEETQVPVVAYGDFVDSQAPALAAAFESRLAHNDGTPMDDVNWNAFIWALAHSRHWIFTAIGTDAPRWEASPVLVVDPITNKWAEHVAALHALADDEHSYALPRDFGLDLLWWGDPPPEGAPQGVVSTLMKVVTGVKDHFPWWPFGHVVTDSLADPSALTRHHLLAHPSSRWGTRDADLARGESLVSRAKDVEQRANALLHVLLSDAPALRLSLGDDATWFAGESCAWTATRYHDDQAMPLDRLSSAERRWANVAIRAGLGLSLEAIYEMANLDSSTWLVMDEPERGLHRTGESHMARGLQELALRGIRTVVATHSPELLDHGLGEVSYVRRRTHDQPGAVIAMGQFDDVREDLGLNPSDMLGRTKGIILVEGEHDLEVLAGAIGSELDRLGVIVLPTRGGSKLKTVVDSRFLYEFTDAVLFPMLDDLVLESTLEIWGTAQSAARVKPASDVIGDLIASLRSLKGKGREYLEEFLAASVKNGTFERVHPLGIPQTDVLLCLPVEAFVPMADSWEQIRDELRRSSGIPEPSETQFKEFLKKRHRADIGAENVRRVARESAVHPDLKALLATMSDRLEK